MDEFVEPIVVKVHFAHELTSCRKKSELKQAYPELEFELMRRPPLLLGEIVQRGIKSYLPSNVEEERVLYKILGDAAIIGTPDFYSESRKSVYKLKFTHRKPKLYEHHRLRASLYKWVSNADHSYLLYCSPRGFMGYEVNDEFDEKDVEALIGNWNSPMWEWECKLCVYNSMRSDKMLKHNLRAQGKEAVLEGRNKKVRQ